MAVLFMPELSTYKGKANPMAEDRLPPVEKGLVDYLARTIPNRVVTRKQDERLEQYALRCAFEEGRQSVITKIADIHSRLQTDPSTR